MEKKLNDASNGSSGFHKFFNFPAFRYIRSTFFCLLFILCCFRCLPRSEQKIFFNSIRRDARYERQSRRRAKKLEKNVELKIYFTIFETKKISLRRNSWYLVGTLNCNSLNCAKHKFHFQLTFHVNWILNIDSILRERACEANKVFPRFSF